MQADLISRPSISSAKTLFPNRHVQGFGDYEADLSSGVSVQPAQLLSLPAAVHEGQKAKATRGPEPM